MGFAFDSGFASGLASGFASAAAPGFESPGLAAFVPLLRKSVAYQPLPLSWKPAALSNFLNVALPHEGQTLSGGSETFCRYSSWKPHSLQRYS